MVVARRNTVGAPVWRKRGGWLGGFLWLWLALRSERQDSQRNREHNPGRSASAPTTGVVKPGSSAEEAFTAFVAAHEAQLFTYLWRATGDEHAAYDLRQETFIRAWRHFAQVRDYDRPLAWLYRVATNLALNERRGRRPTASLTDEEELTASDPSWRLAERDLVHQTLQALPPRERQALALRSGQGLSCEEVADVLEISATAARSLLWRARERFRTLYQAADAERAEPPNTPRTSGRLQSGEGGPR